MSLAAWHLLRHVCEYVGHHTRPTGHGCRGEAMAALVYHPSERVNVRRVPKDSARGAENTRAHEPQET